MPRNASGLEPGQGGNCEVDSTGEREPWSDERSNKEKDRRWHLYPDVCGETPRDLNVVQW